MIFQVSQEPQHVRRIVFRNQRAGNRIIRHRIAGDQNHSMSEVDFVNTKLAGELAQNLGTKLRTVILFNGILQAIIKKSGRQLEQEIAFQGLPNSGCVEFVDQDSINDSLAYFVVVPGLRFDIFWGRTKRFVATTLGSIFAVVNLPPQFLLKCYRTNASDTNPLTPPEFPALRTRSLSRMTRFSYRFGGCFFTSMPGSFFCVFRKPNKGNQAFLCLHRSQIWWRLARSVLKRGFFSNENNFFPK